MTAQNKDEHLKRSLSILFNDISLNKKKLDFKKITVQDRENFYTEFEKKVYGFLMAIGLVNG